MTWYTVYWSILFRKHRIIKWTMPFIKSNILGITFSGNYIWTIFYNSPSEVSSWFCGQLYSSSPSLQWDTPSHNNWTAMQSSFEHLTWELISQTTEKAFNHNVRYIFPWCLPHKGSFILGINPERHRFQIGSLRIQYNVHIEQQHGSKKKIHFRSV